MRETLKILRYIGLPNVVLFMTTCVIWFAMNYVNVKIPLKTKDLIDLIILEKRFDTNLFVTLACMYVLVVVAGLFAQLIVQYVELNAQRNFRRSVLEKLITGNPPYIWRKGVGYVKNILFKDVETFLKILSPRLVSTLFSLTYMALAMIKLGEIHWIYALVLMAYIAVIIPFYRHWFKKNSEGFEKALDLRRKLSGIFTNLLGARTDLHVYGKADDFVRFYHNNLTKFGSSMTNAYNTNLRLQVYPELLQVMTLFGVTLFGLYELVSGAITAGTFQVIVVYSSTILHSSMELAYVTDDISRALAVKKKLWEVLSIDAVRGVETKNVNTLVLKNVCFGYSNKKIVDNFTLVVKKPDIVVLWGKSGSGKTTILDLVKGFYTPIDGGIWLDENEPKSFSYKNVSYLPQEPYIFAETLYENVSLGRELPKERIREILKKCGLGEFCDRLEMKLESGGKNISGGQKSRIALARVLVDPADVILLDEPLTGVDVDRKKEILKKIEEIIADKIVLVSTHDEPVSSIGKRRVNI